MTSYRIAVIGCGVGGMTAAALLADAGHDVTVYERFAQPQPLGAGLLLQPTGLKVLHRLGVEADALALGARIAGIDGRTRSGRTVLRLAYSDLDARLHGLGIHRGALFGLLFERLKRSRAFGPADAVRHSPSRTALSVGLPVGDATRSAGTLRRRLASALPR